MARGKYARRRSDGGGKISDDEEKGLVLREWLLRQKRNGNLLLAALERFATDLRRHKARGSYATARRTAELLRNFVGGSRWSTAAVLVRRVKEVGRTLTKAQPIELAVGNIVRVSRGKGTGGRGEE